MLVWEPAHDVDGGLPLLRLSGGCRGTCRRMGVATALHSCGNRPHTLHRARVHRHPAALMLPNHVTDKPAQHVALRLAAVAGHADNLPDRHTLSRQRQNRFGGRRPPKVLLVLQAFGADQLTEVDRDGTPRRGWRSSICLRQRERWRWNSPSCAIDRQLRLPRATPAPAPRRSSSCGHG